MKLSLRVLLTSLLVLSVVNCGEKKSEQVTPGTESTETKTEAKETTEQPTSFVGSYVVDIDVITKNITADAKFAELPEEQRKKMTEEMAKQLSTFEITLTEKTATVVVGADKIEATLEKVSEENGVTKLLITPTNPEKAKQKAHLVVKGNSLSLEPILPEGSPAPSAKDVLVFKKK